MKRAASWFLCLLCPLTTVDCSRAPTAPPALSSTLISRTSFEEDTVLGEKTTFDTWFQTLFLTPTPVVLGGHVVDYRAVSMLRQTTQRLNVCHNCFASYPHEQWVAFRWYVCLRPVGQCSDHLIISSWEKNTWSNTISRTNTVAVYSWWLWFVMQGDDPGIRKRRKSNRFEKCLVRQHFLWFFCSGSWLLPKLVFPSAFSAHQILLLRKYPSIWLLEEKKFQIHFHMQGIIWARLRVGQSRQYPRQTGKISIIEFDFDRWLGLCSQIYCKM